MSKARTSKPCPEELLAVFQACALFPHEMLKKLGTTYEESLARMEKSRRSPEEMTAFIEGIWRETAKAQREELDRIEQAARKVVESFGGNVIHGIDISYGADIEDDAYHCACDVLRCLSLLRSCIERGDAAAAAHCGIAIGRKLMLGATMDLFPFVEKGIKATESRRRGGKRRHGPESAIQEKHADWLQRYDTHRTNGKKHWQSCKAVVQDLDGERAEHVPDAGSIARVVRRQKPDSGVASCATRK